MLSRFVFLVLALIRALYEGMNSVFDCFLLSFKQNLLELTIFSYFVGTYTFYYPLPEVYRISLFMDPCRNLAYNCCLNVFGVAEYPKLRAGLESERVLQLDIVASDTEVATNYDLVYEDGSAVNPNAQRTAYDNRVIDTSCNAVNKPHKYCLGRNYALVRSAQRPPCSDNNYSLDALAGNVEYY